MHLFLGDQLLDDFSRLGVDERGQSAEEKYRVLFESNARIQSRFRGLDRKGERLGVEVLVKIAVHDGSHILMDLAGVRFGVVTALYLFADPLEFLDMSLFPIAKLAEELGQISVVRELLGGKRVEIATLDLFLDSDVDNIGRLKNCHQASSFFRLRYR